MDKSILEFLVCPLCKGKLTLQATELCCRADRLAFPIKHGIPVMIVDQARAMSADELEER